MKPLIRTEARKYLKQARKQYSRERQTVVVLENIQYARNVATIFRTADAAGVNMMYLTGITHQPPFGKDLRKASRNREDHVQWKHEKDTGKTINKLRKQGYFLVALDLTHSVRPISELPDIVRGQDKVCLVVGNEVHGLSNNTINKCDAAVTVPILSKTGSINLGVSLGIGLYELIK